MKLNTLWAAAVVSCLVPMGSVWAQRQMALGDFNGDHRAEVFRPDGANWWLASPNPGSWSYLNVSASTLANTRLADMNGDGKVDVFHANGTGWWVSYGGTTGWNFLA
ncbi:FG-GAP repeat domain-containing protein, partial [Archangium gephyra]